MNVVTSLKKGKHKLIYISGTGRHSFPENIKGYNVKVNKVNSKNMVELTDLTSKQTEKTFHLHRILEVLDADIEDKEFEERVNWHRDNFLDYCKPLKSFELTKGFLFTKKCSGSYDGETVNLELGNYPDDITRDVFIFRFLGAIIKDSGPCNMKDCKNFYGLAKTLFTKFADDKAYFNEHFTKDYKDDYIDGYQINVDATKEAIREIKEDNELTSAEKKESIEYQELEKELRIGKEILAIVKKDMRNYLLKFFCREFNSKHNTTLFWLLKTVFDVLDFKKIEGYDYERGIG